MSRFYIEVDSENNPVGTPVDEHSVRAIGHFQDGLEYGLMPERYKPFQMTRKVPLEWNQVWAVEGEYRFLDGYWYKHYEARDMTADELAAYQSEMEAAHAAAHPTWTSWAFNSEAGVMSPPVHADPSLQNPQWDEANQTWIEGPELN